MSDFDDAIKDFEKVLKEEELNKHLSDQDILSLKQDLARVKSRKNSQTIKHRGDALFYQEKFDKAIEKYEEALEVDKENEYAIANIGVIHLKK